MADIENVVIFMADGVRWDVHPAAIRNRGTTFRTVASSLHTPTAVASMLTGRYLPNHGVRGFTDTFVADVRPILDWFPTAAVSDTPGNFNDVLYRHLLGTYPQCSLTDLDEPFAWFMRDAAGHAPYDGFDDTLQTDESVASYLKAHGGNVDRIERDYAAGIDSSVDRFERFVLDPLRERGLLERTLIVYASDHGQLLGEYGHVGESYPACPELVYVPTTFIHPSLEAVEREELLRHVDLAATMAGLLDRNVEAGQIEGVDIFAPGADPAYGACFYDRPYPSLRGEFSYTIDSVWNADGGHVFVKSGLWDKLKVFGGFLTRIPAGMHWRRTRNLQGLRMLLENRRTWGEPGLSRAQAREILADIRADGTASQTLELDEAAAENLRELGYL